MATSRSWLELALPSMMSLSLGRVRNGTRALSQCSTTRRICRAVALGMAIMSRSTPHFAHKAGNSAQPPSTRTPWISLPWFVGSSSTKPTGL